MGRGPRCGGLDCALGHLDPAVFRTGEELIFEQLRHAVGFLCRQIHLKKDSKMTNFSPQHSVTRVTKILVMAFALLALAGCNQDKTTIDGKYRAQLAAQVHQLEIQAGANEQQFKLAEIQAELQRARDLLQAETDRLEDLAQAATLKSVGTAAVIGLVIAVIAFLARQVVNHFVSTAANVRRFRYAEEERTIRSGEQIKLIMDGPFEPDKKADLVERVIEENGLPLLPST